MLNALKYNTNKNDYLRLFFRLLQFLLIVAILDVVIGLLLTHYYFKQSSGLQFRTTYAIDSTKADILVFGSSRANHHYHPDVFETRLKMSYYNVGRDGNFMFYHYAVLQAILKRYVPKVIILDFVIDEFKSGQYSYDRLSSLLPYYRDHPEMRNVIELRSPFEQIKLLSGIYPYNSAILTIAAGNSSYNKSRKIDNKGYVPLFSTIENNKIQQAVTSKEFYNNDSLKIHYYESFIRCCIKANVKLYIVCSPYFDKPQHDSTSITKAKEVAARNGVEFLDYSGSPFNYQASMFADELHLNDKGARAFSGVLTDTINAF